MPPPLGEDDDAATPAATPPATSTPASVHTHHLPYHGESSSACGSGSSCFAIAAGGGSAGGLGARSTLAGFATVLAIGFGGAAASSETRSSRSRSAIILSTWGRSESSSGCRSRYCWYSVMA